MAESLPPLATTEELEAYLQRPVPGATALVALVFASGRVRSYINRSLPILVDATTAPDDIRGVVVALAGRVVNNPADLRQEAVGGLSATYGTETIGVTLTDDERRDLGRYRRRARDTELRSDPRRPLLPDTDWLVKP
ncbi:hypothetical protein [Streptomyces sp. SM12]|uniref:hypothetical protein n=1 Tax=Streptomyces sp. SM12 TaxID=1071602 RepID=UPI000CD54B96|nr:hypothetical protein [Streptomyces sp. SM12]